MKIGVVFLGVLQHRGVSSTDSSLLLLVSYPTDEISKLQDVMIKVFLSQVCTCEKDCFPQTWLCFVFSLKYLFIWLLQVLLWHAGPFAGACGFLSSCGTRAIEFTGSGVAVRGLSWLVICGILVPQLGDHVPCIGKWILNYWTPREVLKHGY